MTTSSANSNLEYSGLRPSRFQRTVRGLALESIVVRSSSVPVPTGRLGRITFENITLTNCKHGGCFLYGSIFRDCRVKSLTGGRKIPTMLWGCVFSNVVIEGDVSGLMLRSGLLAEESPLNKKFEELNRNFYRSVDWALDVRKARFSSLTTLQGVPAEKVLRDEEWHFVMSRESARMKINGSKEVDIWYVVAREILDTGAESMVICLGRRGRNYKQDRESALQAKNEGILF